MQNGECTVHLLLSFVRTVFGLHLKDMNVPLLLIKLLRNELRDSNRFSGLWKSYEKTYQEGSSLISTCCWNHPIQTTVIRYNTCVRSAPSG